MSSVTAKHQCKLEHKSWAVCVCFSADGTLLATGAADGTVRVTARNFNLLKTFKEHTDTVSILSVLFNFLI